MNLPTGLQLEGALCPFATRIAATCVEAFCLEQDFEYFAPSFLMKRQICASHTKRGGAMGFLIRHKSRRIK